MRSPLFFITSSLEQVLFIKREGILGRTQFQCYILTEYTVVHNIGVKYRYTNFIIKLYTSAEGFQDNFLNCICTNEEGKANKRK